MDIPVSSIQVNPDMTTLTPPEGGKLLPCPKCGDGITEHGCNFCIGDSATEDSTMSAITKREKR